MKAALEKAKVLVGGVEDDALTRAALAVQYSDMGSARRVEQIIAYLQGKKIPASTALTVDGVRAIVMREIGISVERDDPLLLMLVALQEIELGELMLAIKEFKSRHENMQKAAEYDIETLLPEKKFPLGIAVLFTILSAVAVTALYMVFPGALAAIAAHVKP